MKRDRGRDRKGERGEMERKGGRRGKKRRQRRRDIDP